MNGDRTAEILAAFGDDVRELLIACDGQGRVVWCDDRARLRLGLSPGDPLGALAAPGVESKLEGLLQRGRSTPTGRSEVALRTREGVATYAFAARPDGQGGVWVLVSCQPQDDAQVLGQMQESIDEVVSLNREIARQKRELERAYRELDESNQGVLSLHQELAEKADVLRRTADVRARVVANVSHEFRTPLHSILGLSRLLMDASEQLNEEQQKQVRFIRTSAEELSQMVNDLLDLSQAEAGKVALRASKFTGAELFAALRGMLRPLMPADSPVALVFEDPAEDLAFETDQGKVSQVVRNLVSNALKFTERGEIRVSMSALPGGDPTRVRIVVRDTGIGIAREHFDLIFEEFGQIPSQAQQRVKGSGLGLPLSRRLAELLGGSLTVQSEPGVGSTFTLELPTLHPEVHEIAVLEQRPLDPSRAPVMVVEDDRKTIFIYERYLAMAGFQVVPARTVEDARRLLETVRPAAIVLDIMLEGESTWDFLAQVKGSPETCDIPVLVVTVTAKEQKARALGADEFWLKPIDQDRLLRKLRTLASTGTQTRVLVIDDDERTRYLMRQFLQMGAFELLEAATGPDGVAIARRERPHVIFLDFLLEDVTAFDVLDELKADTRTRGIPVIVISSHVLDADQRQRLAAETEAILSKESLSRELAIHRIRDALGKAGVATLADAVSKAAGTLAGDPEP